MKVTLDQDVCIGCGLCEQLAPEVFKMDGEKASVISSEVAKGKEADAKGAVEQCPVSCITVS